MPYTSVSEVPEHVKEPEARQKWLATFNGVWEEYKKKGWDDKKIEGVAFAIANSMYNKWLMKNKK